MRAKVVLLFTDFVLLSALNFAILGFTVNGIFAGLGILPFYDFLSTQEYVLALILIFVASSATAYGIYRKSLVAILSGSLLQLTILLNEVANRTAFVPKFLVLLEDPNIFSRVYGNLPRSFYSAPSYDLVDVLTFLCFVLGVVLLFFRLAISLGPIRSVFLTILVSSATLLYFEYVAIHMNIEGVSSSWIASERLTNFSNSWPIVGSLTNAQFSWICLIALFGSLAGCVFICDLRIIDQIPIKQKNILVTHQKTIRRFLGVRRQS